jgi:uncharacterized protein YdeI (YjbR/CyaY-like superfamily)
MPLEGKRNPKVDAFIEKSTKWRAELAELRRIILKSGLTEEVKWGAPCYTLDGKNVVLIQGFKEYCAVMFVKGALLKNYQGILIQQTGDVQAGRQVRFTDIKDINDTESTLMLCISDAIAAEKAGLKVEKKKTSDFPVPDEFESKMDASPALKAAFDSLTPGRQRAYLYYFSAAKQSKTRASRVENYIPKILDGKGLDD